ncbi:MAG: ATP-binding protein [Acidobacteriota bacterium]
MARATGSPPSSRRLLVGFLVFGLFVLFDVALFGWLIVRSLSQRELEKALLETRHEAEGLASRIAGRATREGKDLYTAIALERETQTYIDSVLRQRDIVQTVEIHDREGRLVLRSSKEATQHEPPIVVAPELKPRETSPVRPPQVEQKTYENRSTYDIAVPIADLGTLFVGISRVELEQRIAVLRGDLTRQATWIGGITFALLISAYVSGWMLWKRSRRLEEQAKEAERLAYIGTLASGLAHEIRNPLNSLSLNMQLLEEEIGERNSEGAGGSRRLLQITRDELGRLEHLVTDFLSYARPRPLALEAVLAVSLLEHTLEVLAGQLQARGVRVEIEDRSGGAYVLVDRAQMGQLLLNLAHNALAAMEGSERTPRLRMEARLELPAPGRPAHRVVLEVADNGGGIPPEVQSQIFDLFFSTRKGGTGLGLAIVERIAKAHEGLLAVSSVVGQGTSICVSLAAAEPSTALAKAAIQSGQTVSSPVPAVRRGGG